ncbi:MAG: tRNA 2-thiouridine(34) synthase MnmA [bacterium]|nr:MAG: tRNA 2-thiouridine(34) synthase MnmA [bacterium]
MISRKGRVPTGEAERSGVVVGMSGGVDSSVAAWSLHEQGYRVVGVTLRLFCYSGTSTGLRPCCSKASLDQARRLCHRLGILHHVVDVEDRFRRAVIDYFVREYRRGRTPNPCIVCNEKIKFPVLSEIADSLGFSFIATGHYVRTVQRPGGRFLLARADDSRKDQSYFLYRVPVGLLGRSLFPLGTLHKTEVKRLAQRLGVRSSGAHESQDVCFIPGGDLRAFLESRIGQRPGQVVGSDGIVLGRHRGVFNYTVGQRRGLGIAGGVPLYVKEIDVSRNRIVLATDEMLYVRHVSCDGVRLRMRSPDGPLTAKIRYRHQPAQVRSLRRGRGSMEIRFTSPQRAATPGQSLVLYRDDEVVGGGIIACTR